MMIELYAEEIVELIRLHRSAAIRAMTAANRDKAHYHESRAAHLMEISGITLESLIPLTSDGNASSG